MSEESKINPNSFFNQPEGDDMPEVLPVQMAEGDNTSSNYVNKMIADQGAFKNDTEIAEGTYCPIGSIQMMKSNSIRHIFN